MKRPRANSLFPVFALALLIFSFGRVYGQGMIKVEYQNGRVNMLVENRTFGEVLDSFAGSAHFTVKVPPEERAKKISIRLHDADMDKAVTRLFTLVEIRNYSVQYGSGGEIRHIEVIVPKKVDARPEGRIPPQTLRQKTEGRQPRSRTYTPPQSRPRRYRPQYVVPQEPGGGPPPDMLPEEAEDIVTPDEEPAPGPNE